LQQISVPEGNVNSRLGDALRRAFRAFQRDSLSRIEDSTRVATESMTLPFRLRVAMIKTPQRKPSPIERVILSARIFSEITTEIRAVDQNGTERSRSTSCVQNWQVARGKRLPVAALCASHRGI